MSLCLFYAYLCSKKDMNKIILSVFALLLYSCGTTNTNIVTRKNLLSLHLNEKHTLSNIIVERIVIPKGGKADYHLHPCPVVGLIVSGNLLFQIDGQASQYMTGDVFYEPKNQPIAHFDNASTTNELIFIAYYLLTDNEKKIELLPKKEE